MVERHASNATGFPVSVSVLRPAHGAPDARNGKKRRAFNGRRGVGWGTKAVKGYYNGGRVGTDYRDMLC